MEAKPTFTHAHVQGNSNLIVQFKEVPDFIVFKKMIK